MKIEEILKRAFSYGYDAGRDGQSFSQAWGHFKWNDEALKPNHGFCPVCGLRESYEDEE
jgi:hypothetical protein